jgi:HEPN domain-containing protein
MAERFREVLAENLHVIDGILAEQAVDIPSRPFQATCMFITECIVEIEGDNKEKFLEKSWFPDLFQWVLEWYEVRYGEAALRSKERPAAGFVLLFGTPFRLNIPLTITVPGAQADIVELNFLTNIWPNEAVLSWLVGAPNIDRLDSNQRSALEHDISAVGSITRSLCTNLIMADLSKTAQQLSSSIPTHITNCVDGIVSLEGIRRSLSMWELFMAVEKVLKVFLHQRNGVAAKTHSLSELFRASYANGLPLIDPVLIQALPESAEAIQQRYGERNPPTVEEGTVMYRSALAVMELCARSLSRNAMLKDGRFFIRRLPWARDRKP